MKPGRVCTKCYRDAPCSIHTRPKNARWSRDRDGAAQNRFRTAVLTRDQHRCVRCGATQDLVAHHTKPGYTADCGITLCRDCHKLTDPWAR